MYFSNKPPHLIGLSLANVPPITPLYVFICFLTLFSVGFYDQVRPLSPEEEQLYDELELDVSLYKEAVGVRELKG